MITLPSWESSRPAPTPKSARAIANMVPFSSTSIVPSSTSDATTSATRPAWATRLGAKPAASRGPGIAASEHRDRHREQALAGVERVEPEDDLQVDGQDEEGPEQDQLLHHQRGQPGAQLPDPQQRAVQQRVAALALAALLPEANPARQPSPARIRNGTTEKPNGVISRSADRQRAARLDQPPLAALEDAEDDEPEPERGDRDADHVELRAGARGAAALGSRRRSSRITATITVSPANT